MRKLFLLLTACLMLLFTGVVGAEGATEFDDGYITVDGFGVPPAWVKQPAKGRIMARRAAIVDAQRNLAEAVSGVQVDAETTVKDMELQSDVVKTQLSALVKGAQVVSEGMEGDGSYRVTMRVPVYGAANSLASTVMPQSAAVEPFPAPTAAYQPTGGGYTGLVVDCRGLGLQCAMSPTIRNESNQPIYGHTNLESQKVVGYGVVGYSKDGVNNMGRAGAKPLTVKAIRLENHNFCPVVSNDDANRILGENAVNGFLANCAVVFIR